MKLLLALLLVPLFPALSAAADPEVPVSSVAWHVKTSPHFEIMHESVWSPGSIALELERMYSTMRLNMAMFAPWMVREKAKVYIYSSQKSYLSGEFRPPLWSKGLAYSGRKTIVVYDTGDQDKLKAVIAHELTHLYMEGYFAEKLKYLPQWLNEGLAVYMEDAVFQGGGPWGRALPYLGPERRIPYPDFFSQKIDGLKGDAKIADWYLQSYGTVLYLYRPSTRLQFKAFCEGLREGGDLDELLWKSYRVAGRDFGPKWASWLAAYGQGGQGSFGSSAPSASFNFKPVQLSSFSFVNFGSKK